MKLEAFNGRGRGDCLGSRDFEDIALLLDRRAELVDEIEMADEDLRRYVAQEPGKLLDDQRTQGGLMGAVPPDDVSQDRVPTVLLPALRALAELSA
jgi:hypothetical protein